MKALEMAISIEMEGKEFYAQAAEKAGDELGKALFIRLAIEEDFHMTKAREIWGFLSRSEIPLAIEESLDRGQEISQIFIEARQKIGEKREVAPGEWEAIQTAMDLEEKSRVFYEDQSKSVNNEFIKRFFTALSYEERGHYLSLVDYKEFLTDPADWYTRAEHHSLDGG